MTEYQCRFKMIGLGERVFYQYLYAKSQNSLRCAMIRFNRQNAEKLKMQIVGGGVEIERTK